MFWEEVAATENSMQILLKSPLDLTLSKVLDDQFVLQELRSGNKTLIDFLTQKDVLLQVLNTALYPTVSDDEPVTNQYKQSLTCSEILTVRNNDDLVNAFIECADAVQCLINALENLNQMNHLVASFLSKIVANLISRQFNQTMALFESSDFLAKCMNGMQFGAVCDMLQNIISEPKTIEDSEGLKQYFAKEHFSERLVKLLDVSQSDCVHSNVADIYINITKTCRDLLFTFDDKTDVLHDSLFTDDIVKSLCRQLLTRDDCGALNASLVRNCSAILTVLVRENGVMQAPSSLLADDGNWVGGVPGETTKPESTELVWRPDEKRLVEMTVAEHSAELVSAIIVDLEKLASAKITDIVQPTNWLYLLRLLVAVLDTNHLPTHKLLLEGFKASNFPKLFHLVNKLPNCSLFHRLLEKLVAFPLYSNCTGEKSPIVNYLFEDCELVNVLLNGVTEDCDGMKRLDVASFRSFFLYLGHTIENAKKYAFSMDVIEGYLKNCDNWDILSGHLAVHSEKIRVDQDTSTDSARSSNDCNSELPPTSQSVDSSFDPSERRQRIFEVMTDMNAPHLVGQMVEPFDDDVSTSFSEHHYSSRSVLGPKAPDLSEMDDRVDERDFENMCRMKNVDFQEWPEAFGSADDEWPTSTRNHADEDWPTDPAGVSSSFVFKEDWDCPPSNTNPSSVSRQIPDAADGFEGVANTSTTSLSSARDASSSSNAAADEWADFSSAKPAELCSSDPWQEFASDKTELTSSAAPLDDPFCPFPSDAVPSSSSESTLISDPVDTFAPSSPSAPETTVTDSAEVPVPKQPTLVFSVTPLNTTHESEC